MHNKTYLRKTYREGKTASERKRHNEWIAEAQRNSWHLELVFSGIALLGLRGVLTYLHEIYSGLEVLSVTTDSLLIRPALLIGIAFEASQLLIVMFGVHLLLRGLWIAAIGIRKTTETKTRITENYQPVFTRFLLRRLGIFDDYLLRLDEHSKLMFATALLVFFVVISLGFFIILYSIVIGVIIGGLLHFIEPIAWYLGTLGDWGIVIIIPIIVFVVMIIALIVIPPIFYVMDFLTFGRVKHWKSTSGIYYRFYRFFGWLALARIYRPLYYQLIEERKNGVILIIFILTYFVISFAADYDRQSLFKFHPPVSVEKTINANFYTSTVNYRLDLEYAAFPSLAEREVSSDYQEIFIPYNPYNKEASVVSSFDSLDSPWKDFLGISFLHFSPKDSIGAESLLEASLANQQIFLNDSLLINLNWRFYEHPIRKQPGYVCFMPVYDLPRGEYLLRFEARVWEWNEETGEREEVWWEGCRIYFYK